MATPTRSTTGTVESSTDASFDASGTAVTFSFDAGSDTNRYLAIDINWDGAGGHTLGDTVVTYNSVALTPHGATITGTNNRFRSYYMVAPATGSNTVSVDPSAGSDVRAAIITVRCFSTVDQSTPFNNYTTATGTDASNPYTSPLTITSASTDRLVAVAHGVRATSVTGGTATGFTERTDNVNGVMGMVTGDEPGAASVATSVSWAGVFAIDYLCTGVSLIGVSTGPNPTSVSPDFGRTTGGTAVTITGTGFDASGGTSEGVTFDGVAATSVVFVGATSITCVTPAGSAGAVDVVVTNGDATTGTLVNGYTYTVGPIISSPMGPTNGSGVVPTGDLTDDEPLDGTSGQYLEVALTCSRGTLYTACLPETP